MSGYRDLEPSADAIRDAVANFGQAEARESLQRWGNAALPHLRALLEGEGSDDHAFMRLVTAAIRQIRTAESTCLIVELAASRTAGVDATLPLISRMFEDEAVRRELDALPAFKPAVLALATHESRTSRSNAATIIGRMGWVDAIPLLTTMTEDENLSLRETAAVALHALGAAMPPIRRPALAFPRAGGTPCGLERIGPLPRSGWMTSGCAFQPWFDGSPALIQWRGGELLAYGPDLRPRASIAVAPMLHDFVMLPGASGHPILVAAASDERQPNASHVIGIDAAGEVLWTVRPRGRDVESITALYDDSGQPEAVAVGHGGADGISGVDARGARTFEIPDQFVLYDVVSHPRLPDLFASCGGVISVFRSGRPLAARIVSAKVSSKPSDIYASGVVLFPDAQGRPALMVAGVGAHSEPRIVRLDEALQPVWAATLPNRVSELGMCETAARPRVFVAVTDAGDMLLFDEEGTLLAQQSLGPVVEHKTAQGKTPLFGLETGSLDGNTPCFSVGTVAGPAVYRIRA